MSFREIIERLSTFALPVLFIGIIFVVLLVALYMFMKKRKPDGYRFSIRVPLVSALLIGYLFVVFGLTGLSRGGNFSGSVNLNFMSGYLDAWNSYSVIAFQLIIFNIIMFIPLGILLPFLHKRFRRFWWTFFASFGATLLIETFQLITGRGIFELDDLFHNTLGGIIGFHLYKLTESILKKRKVSLKDGKYLLIPLILVLIFAGVQMVYHSQEFGNLKINPAFGTDMSKVQITNQLKLDDEPGHAPVYKNVYANDLEHGRTLARDLQKDLGLPEKMEEGRDGENRQFLFSDNHGDRYSLTYFIRDATWMLMNENYLNEDGGKKEDREKLQSLGETILKKLDLLPEEARPVAGSDEQTNFQWRINRTEYPKRDITEGLVMMELSNDGKVNSLDNFTTQNEYIREVELISPQAAYNRFIKGKFDQYNPFKEGDSIVVEDYHISYVFDSKGYYQPVYEFTGKFNGESDWYQQIAAIKK